MKDLPIAKLKKLIDALRERKVTSFKYRDIEFKLSYPMEQSSFLDEEEELTPEQKAQQDEAIVNWSS